MRDEIRIAWVFWTAVALAGLAALYAIFGARDLVDDGSYYLLGIAAHGQFQLLEPPRATVQILQQCFAVMGARLGGHDLWRLGQLFSLGVSGWPVLLTALCWFALPRGEKTWALGPLLNLVLAIPAASFIGISEDIIASCLLWLAFLLVEFRLQRPLGALASMIAMVACVFSHESAIVFLIIIAAAAVSRVPEQRGLARWAALIIFVLAAGAALNMLRWIVFPRSMIERSDFLVGLMGGFLGSPDAPNMPALASLVAILAAGAALMRRSLSKAATIACIAALACLLLILFVRADNVISPGRFFAARGLPIALSTVLAIAVLLLRRRGAAPFRFATPAVLIIVTSLAVTQAVAQAQITQRWNQYIDDLRHFVSTHSGAVSHAKAMAVLDASGTAFRRELLESWSVEPLSILLAPHGRVLAIVEPALKARWIPWRVDDPNSMPHVPELDWSHYSVRP